MASSVVVLTPNGRRVTIKVTPNTTILQVLEEACKKQELQPDLYDLKHHRRVLDTTLTMRFSGLPNNCLLELIEAQVARTEVEVTVGIQLEDGKRIMDNFIPSNSVWDVLNKLCPSELKENTVIIYMRSEIYGEELKNTKLKTLGITNGRAMLRLLHRSPEELKVQANVSAPLPLKPAEEKPYKRQFQKLENFEEFKAPVKSENNFPEATKETAKNEDMEEEEKEEKKINFKPQNKSNNDLVKQIKMEKQKQTTGMMVKNNKQPKREVSSPPSSVQPLTDDFVFLGDRNAMLFSLETSQAVRSEDLPDDFFELSITDVKKMFRDIKKRRIELEQGGELLTTAMRKLEDTKKQLRTLHQYRKSVIRVQFPSRMVLQGIFGPEETVDAVFSFVREYLADKSLDFHLFTTPPKNVLPRDLTLLEADCVPGALLHFGCDEKRDNYLREDILTKLSTTSTATVAATKIRMEYKRNNVVQNEDDVEMFLEEDVNVGASTSANESPSYEEYERKTNTPAGPQEKVPKWFKPSK